MRIRQLSVQSDIVRGHVSGGCGGLFPSNVVDAQKTRATDADDAIYPAVFRAKKRQSNIDCGAPRRVTRDNSYDAARSF